MSRLTQIREQRSALAKQILEIDAELASIVDDESRSLTADDDAKAAELLGRSKALGEEDAKLAAVEADLVEHEARTERARKVPQIMKPVEVPEHPAEVRSLDRGQARDAAMKLLEDRAAVAHLDNADEVREEIARKIATVRNQGRHGRFDGDQIARRLLITESDAYRSAFMKGVFQATPVFTAEEAAAVLELRNMSIGTDTAGGFGVPVLIDPSIILTAQGSLNPFRQIARVISITTDEWKGVSSAGVSWSVDGEATAVSNDAPTLAQPTVTTGTARGFIPFSIEVGMDYPSFAAEMGTLLMEGYDELQSSHFASASTSSTNRGILTALDANTNVEVTPTTDGAFGAVDINRVWGALPDRFKANATWVMNHDVGNEVSSFSTSGMGSFFTVDLSQGNAPQLKGRPVAFSSYFPDFTGTTGAANILVVGDFRNFVIVDRAGMNLELVPHMLDVTNNRPTGQRGWFAWARFGSNSVNDLGFRLLQNQ